MKKQTFIVLSIVTLLGSIFLGSYLAKRYGTPTFEHATMISPPKDLSGLSLIAADGTIVTEEQFKGHWTILTVGYGHCPDTCPATLGFLKNEMAELGSENIEVAFVSVDADRDNPQALGEFVRSFDPRFNGYLASEAMVQKLTELLGAYTAKNADGTLAHSNAIFILSPEAKWVGVYTSPPLKGLLASDLSRVKRS